MTAASRAFFALTPHHDYEQRVVAVPGGDITYGIWEPRGAADAPTVLAAHGLTGNHRCWSYVVDRLRGYRVIAPDLRGRGASNSITTGFGLLRHAEDLESVLDAVGVRQALLLGHSMGGLVCVIFADRCPGRVAGMVVVDGGVPAQGTTDPRRTQQVISPMIARLTTVYPDVGAAVRFWRRHPAFVDDWTPLVDDYARYDLGGAAPHLRSRTTVDSVRYDSADIAGGATLLEALDRLDRPFTMLAASHGLLNEAPGLYPPPAIVRWQERYPQATFYPIHGTNHYTIIMSRRGAYFVADSVRARDRGAACSPAVLADKGACRSPHSPALADKIARRAPQSPALAGRR